MKIQIALSYCQLNTLDLCYIQRDTNTRYMLRLEKTKYKLEKHHKLAKMTISELEKLVEDFQLTEIS